MLLMIEKTKGEMNWPANNALVLSDKAQPLKSELTWLEMVKALNGTRQPIPNPVIKTAM